METENRKLTKKVEDWWDNNPFTYNGRKGVGRNIETDEMDIDFFVRMDKKFRKNTGTSVQVDGKPLFSNFIDYEKIKGKKVLDIACGTGIATVDFAKNNCDVIGIDITKYAVDATNRNLSLRGLRGKALKMDAQNLEFEDESFDFVCAHGCLMHMPDTKRAVSEIYRVLKKDAEVYAWMYHKGWYYWFNILFLRGILQGKLFKYKFNTLKMTSRYTDGSHEQGNPHTKLHSKKEFRELFEGAGFKDVKVNVNYNEQEMMEWPMLRLPLGKYLPRFITEFLSKTFNLGLGCSITAKK